jgi:SAM-dependent methyltransferase
MQAILRDAGALDMPAPRLAVDIGCSRGFFTAPLAPYFSSVVGVDIDAHALHLAQAESRSPNVGFVSGDSQRLPFADASAQLVICNHVYEHVPEAERLFNEIERVLAPGGMCYLGAASRLTLMEPHYHLPFLSWLPKPLAHRYMRAAGKGDFYYERLRTYQGICRLISRFEILDYTLKVVADPDRYAARDLFPKGGLLERIPMWIWKSLYWFLPSYIFILRKPL